MKKLMIAAAIVCAAAVSQAASVAWDLAKDADKTYGNKTIYAVAGGDFAAVQAILEAGGDDVATKFMNYALVVDKANTAKSVDLNSRGAGGGIAEVGDATSIAFFVFKDAIANDNVYDTTGVIDVNAYVYTPPASSPGNYEFDPSAFASKNNTIGAAPEPTSAMLLLLGVAGLALRRRRA